MCGIAGVLYTDDQRPAQYAILQAMGDAIAHRGPDGEGFFRDGNLGMVHRRLAIIDPAGGDQPIGNEDGSIQIVFNGEIYNFAQLRAELEHRGHSFRTNSDTEVLVHLYEDTGRELVSRLRGMFAFAIWDSRRRQLLLARDHLGQKPLYVYRDHEKLLFGSELKAILAHPAVDRSVSGEAIEDYLTFGVIPGERSVFEKIQRLPAAHTLVVSSQNAAATARRYWNLRYGTERECTVDDWKQQVDNALTTSVRSHLVADVPVGAFLSGGLDSSAIVACASKLIHKPLQTFSIGFAEKEFSELPSAESVARYFGTDHHEEIVTPDAVRDLDQLVHYFDEPFADASAIPTMAVARMASQHVKVCLSGDGGDEVFGGYARYIHDLKETAIRDVLPLWLRRAVLNPLSAIWPRADWLPRPFRLKSLLQNLAAHPAAAYANTVSMCRRQMRNSLLRNGFRQQVARHRPETYVEEAFTAGHRDALSGMLSADVNFLLPDDFLTKVDRASMASGLEVRPPLLDIDLMELAASMPSALKVRGGSGKWILKELFTSRLPPRLAQRRKQGFELPIDAWLRTSLRDQVHEVVLNENAPLSKYINISAADTLYRHHCRGTARHGQVLWSLLVLGRWLQQYTNSSGAAAVDSRSLSGTVATAHDPRTARLSGSAGEHRPGTSKQGSEGSNCHVDC